MKQSPIPDVSELTLEEKIGQMLCLGWDGGEDALLRLNDQALECVAELGAGAMILMTRNIRSPGAQTIDVAGVRAMTDALQSHAPRVPLLVATDQEGGRVSRLSRPPFTPLPCAHAVGATGRPDLGETLARIAATELVAVGIDLDFAPVADVDTHPDNPIIGDRAFTEDPRTAAVFVAASVRGLRAGGVLACAKHFPGHGDTHLDSHLALPTVDAPMELLEERELIPFRAAIAAGIPAIMTAHIRFPLADRSGLPATLSRFWLTDMLRTRLAFTGLVITDCLEMRAVADRWGAGAGAVLAANAGADMILVCHTIERQREARDALLAAARDGVLPLERVDDAVRRVLAAKRLSADLHRTGRPPLDVVGAPEHRRISAEIGDVAHGADMAASVGEAAPDVG